MNLYEKYRTSHCTVLFYRCEIFQNKKLHLRGTKLKTKWQKKKKLKIYSYSFNESTFYYIEDGICVKGTTGS